MIKQWLVMTWALFIATPVLMAQLEEDFEPVEIIIEDEENDNDDESSDNEEES